MLNKPDVPVAGAKEKTGGVELAPRMPTAPDAALPISVDPVDEFGTTVLTAPVAAFPAMETNPVVATVLLPTMPVAAVAGSATEPILGMPAVPAAKTEARLMLEFVAPVTVADSTPALPEDGTGARPPALLIEKAETKDSAETPVNSLPAEPGGSPSTRESQSMRP